MSEKGKRWTIPEESRDKVKELILSYGAIEKSVSNNEYLKWRLSIGKSIFDLFTNGTLLNNQATSETILELREKISSFSSSNFHDTKKELKIGLDETGKGELFGHEVLCGVMYPSSIANKVDEIIGLANTKSRKSFEYWDGLFAELAKLQVNGLVFKTQNIPPWDIDRYNTNKIMDIVYKKIIGDLCRDIQLENTSLVIDNYGLDDNLLHFLFGLEKQGMLVKIETKADEKFLETKLASIIAKRSREKSMQGINERFKINGQKPGSGNLSDQDTIEWLKKWKKSGKDWPWFVKQSVSTIRNIDGKKGKVKKFDPPIRHEMISDQARKLFNDGKLSTDILRISCPECGKELQAILFTKSQSGKYEGRCPSCKKLIPDLQRTLLYYSGTILPDTSAIIAGIISKDLQTGGSKFFENYTILLNPKVENECENSGAKAELGKIADIASYERINLITLNEIINYNMKTDDEVIASAKKNNAIILTADMGQYAKAIGYDLFSIALRFDSS